jgi:hypothetical protein
MLLAACTSATPPPQVLPPTSLPLEPTRSPTTVVPTLASSAALTPEPAATEPPLSNPADSLPAYTFTATYNYSAHTLTVSEQISYTNQTSQSFNELLMVVEANRYPGSLSIQSITASQQPLDGYTLEGNHLTLPLASLLEPGGAISLSLEYTLVLPEIPEPSDTARPQPYGFTLRQANLVDWYPYIPPYDEVSGWLAPEPGYFGEHQVLPLADFRLVLRVPEIGVPLTVAASTPAQLLDEGYTFDLPAARSFALSISPMYTVLSGEVEGITVHSYCFTYDTYAGQAALDHTLQALALYQELFGPYPRQSLSIVQADFLDGMEYDGLYFLSRGFYNIYDGTPAGYLTAIAVHETAHQWWYGLVGNDQAHEPWLDEALCTYAERLYYERYYPQLLPWWWAYRVDFYEPSGPINRTIYDYPTFRAYRDAVYLNGAHFLEAVRQQLGDEAFFATLRDYAAAFRGGSATSADLLAAFAAHADEDLSPLFANFFE